MGPLGRQAPGGGQADTCAGTGEEGCCAGERSHRDSNARTQKKKGPRHPAGHGRCPRSGAAVAQAAGKRGQPAIRPPSRVRIWPAM